MNVDDGIAALEDVINDDGLASWANVEEFFRDASFEWAFDVALGRSDASER